MIEVLQFVFDSWWNTFAAFMLVAFFRPVRIVIKHGDDKEDKTDA